MWKVIQPIAATKCNVAFLINETQRWPLSRLINEIKQPLYSILEFSVVYSDG